MFGNIEFMAMFVCKKLFFLLLLLSVFIVGCTTEPVIKKNRLAVGSILVLPVTSAHDELLVDAELILERLESQLKSYDFAVFRIPDTQVKAFQEQALELSGSVYSPKIKKSVPLDKLKYKHHLIKLIASQYDFDAVALPELWLRSIRVKEDEASWDGVSRDIEFINKPEKNYKLPKSARGISLRLTLLSRKGALIDASFGGMSLPYKVNYEDGKAGFDLKETFYSQRDIKEAVKIVLTQLNVDIRAK